jgi:hypothetical protein
MVHAVVVSYKGGLLEVIKLLVCCNACRPQVHSIDPLVEAMIWNTMLVGRLHKIQMSSALNLCEGIKDSLLCFFGSYSAGCGYVMTKCTPSKNQIS